MNAIIRWGYLQIRWAVFPLFLAVCCIAHADQLAKDVPPGTKSSRQCPDNSKLEVLCHSVTSMLKDREPNTPYEFTYQRYVYEAACADIESDSEAEISRKINQMWKQLEDKPGSGLRCTSPSLGVTSGTVLELAVVKKFREFLVEAAHVWRLDLNKVDEVNGRTVLDYVSRNIERNKGNANEAVFQQYYKMLRKAGAKHKSELAEQDPRYTGSPAISR